MPATYGFVYFLSNPVMPGVYKIGYTDQHPQNRVDQISSATGCPMPYELAACFGAEDAREVEQAIHAEYRHRRVNRSREFFRLKASDVLKICEEYANKWSNPVLTQPAEYEAMEQAAADDVQWRINHFLSQSADPIFWPKKFEGLD